MEYKKTGDSLSIVVLCEMKPIFIHLQWMNERGIITGQEFDESVNKAYTLNEGQSIFMIGNDIKVYCDRNRFQIETTDVSVKNRIIDICQETLRLTNPNSSSAVGVNAYMDFTFLSNEDVIRFGDKFVPLDQWSDIIPNPRVVSFTIQENLLDPTKTRPRRTIIVQSIEVDKKTGFPIVRINVNNHHPIKVIGDLEEVLSNSSKEYKQFFGWCDRIFKEKLA